MFLFGAVTVQMPVLGCPLLRTPYGPEPSDRRTLTVAHRGVVYCRSQVTETAVPASHKSPARGAVSLRGPKAARARLSRPWEIQLRHGAGSADAMRWSRMSFGAAPGFRAFTRAAAFDTWAQAAE